MTNWQKQYDKGINKLLGEYDFPAVTSFLIAFSKDFIEKELYSQAKKDMLRCKKAKIMTAEATRDFILGQIEKMLPEKNEETLCDSITYGDTDYEANAVNYGKNEIIDQLKSKLKTLTK